MIARLQPDDCQPSLSRTRALLLTLTALYFDCSLPGGQFADDADTARPVVQPPGLRRLVLDTGRRRRGQPERRE
jgi:hypothetical protein